MDMDRQADEVWILGVQRKLYQWSQAKPGDAWRDMWGWLTDFRMLRHSMAARRFKSRCPLCRRRREGSGIERFFVL